MKTKNEIVLNIQYPYHLISFLLSFVAFHRCLGDLNDLQSMHFIKHYLIVFGIGIAF